MVWHYTSAKGQLGILDEGKIWASDLRFLNDETENVKIWKVIRERLETRGEDEYLAFIHRSNLGHTETIRSQYDGYIEDIKRSILADDVRNVFVACFSGERDSLSQWRAYTTGSGYAVGFSADALAQVNVSESEALGRVLSGVNNMRFAQVTYLSDKDSSKADSIIDFLLSYHYMRVGQSAPRFLLTQLSPFIKDSKFKEEAEWRLACEIKVLKRFEIEFRNGLSHLIPYLKIDLRTRNPDYIKEIMVGPGPSSDRDLFALECLKRARELHFEVSKSDIPFRNW